MKHYMRILAGLGSLAILMQNGAAFPAVPRITAQAASVESMHLRVFTYDFGSFQALYDTVSKKWYDTEGNPLEAESKNEQSARFNGQDVTVNLTTGNVVDSMGGELPALSQCVADYLGRTDEWISYAPQYYDKAQQRYVDVPKPEQFPLSFRFDQESDKFACNLYFGDQFYCTLAYQQQGYAAEAAVLGERTTARSLPFTDIGDTTLDGEVNVCDAVLTCRTVGDEVDVPITELGRELADANKDGKVDAEDTSTMMFRLAGIDPVARRYPDIIDTWAEIRTSQQLQIPVNEMYAMAEKSGNQLDSGAAYTGGFACASSLSAAGDEQATSEIVYYYRAPDATPSGIYCIRKAEFNPNNRTVQLYIGRCESATTDVQPDVRRFSLLLPDEKYDFSGWDFKLIAEDMSYNAVQAAADDRSVQLIKKGTAMTDKIAVEDVQQTSPDADSAEVFEYGGMIENGGEFELYDVVRTDDYDTLKLSYVNGKFKNGTIHINSIEMDSFGALVVHASRLPYDGGKPNAGVHLTDIRLQHGVLPEPTGVRYVFDGTDALQELTAISAAKQDSSTRHAMFARATVDDNAECETIRSWLEGGTNGYFATFFCDAHTRLVDDEDVAALQGQFRDSASVYVMHDCQTHYAVTGAVLDQFNHTLTLTVGYYNDQSGLASVEPIFSRVTLDWPQYRLQCSNVKMDVQFVNYGTDEEAFEAASKSYVYIEDVLHESEGTAQHEIPCSITEDWMDFPAPGDSEPAMPSVWQVRNANEYKAYCKAFGLEENADTAERLKTKDLIFVRATDSPCQQERLSRVHVSYDGTLAMYIAQWGLEDVCYEIGLPSVYTIETAKGAMPTVGKVKISYLNYTSSVTEGYGADHMRFVLENWNKADSITYSEPVVPREWLLGDTAVESPQMWYETSETLQSSKANAAAGYVLTDPEEIAEQLTLCGENAADWDISGCDMLVLSVNGLNTGVLPALKSAEIDCPSGRLNAEMVTYLPQESAQNRLCAVNMCFLIEKDKLPDFSSVNVNVTAASDAYTVQSAQKTKLTISAVPNSNAGRQAAVLTGAPVSRTLPMADDYPAAPITDASLIIDKTAVEELIKGGGWNSDAIKSLDPQKTSLLLVSVPNSYQQIHIEKASCASDGQIWLEIGGCGKAENHTTEFCLALPSNQTVVSYASDTVIVSDHNYGDAESIEYRMTEPRSLTVSEAKSSELEIIGDQAGWFESADSAAEAEKPAYEVIKAVDNEREKQEDLLKAAGLPVPEQPLDLLVLRIPMNCGGNQAGVQSLFLRDDYVLRANVGIYTGEMQYTAMTHMTIVIPVHQGMLDPMEDVEFGISKFCWDSWNRDLSEQLFRESLPEKLSINTLEGF